MSFIQKHSRGVIIKVFVQPRASKNAIVGCHGDALKITLTSPPIDGAANKMCVQFLAKCLQLPKSSIEILSGHTSRTKRILLCTKDEKNLKSEQERLTHSVALLLPS
jgi:uncharacterized protein (TIGR00251 family)